MPPQPQRRLLDELRARGVRLTSQRTVLIRILDGQEGFVDVATLCAIAWRRGARVDRATVYRTLALLRANDLLAPVAGAQDGSGKEEAAAPVTHDILGLICEQCGMRQAVAVDAPDSIKRELRRCTGFNARAMRLEASGACRLCAARAQLLSRAKDKSGFQRQRPQQPNSSDKV